MTLLILLRPRRKGQVHNCAYRQARQACAGPMIVAMILTASTRSPCCDPPSPYKQRVALTNAARQKIVQRLPAVALGACGLLAKRCSSLTPADNNEATCMPSFYPTDETRAYPINSPTIVPFCPNRLPDKWAASQK